MADEGGNYGEIAPANAIYANDAVRRRSRAHAHAGIISKGASSARRRAFYQRDRRHRILAAVNNLFIHQIEVRRLRLETRNWQGDPVT